MCNKCQNKENKKPFYVTTPIYYPSANLHLGNTYTTIVADTLKRYKELKGYDVFFVTGTDEHGEKLAKVAMESQKTPLEYIDPIVKATKKLWKDLDLKVDNFVRSTSEQHEKDVQEIFSKLYEKGDIYKGTYKGYYCTPCEAFWTETQLVDGKCKDCGREVHFREEESYFFRLSKYQDRILKYLEENPEFLQPESRKKEMIGSFLKQGLEDLSVTRKELDWGVKVPFDDTHTIYVWIDALICYLTGIGYGEDKEKFERYWSNTLHLLGKDIIRFHAIIWVAVLMALDMPIPKRLFAHGWILFDNDKMSKSKKNIVYPEPIIELYGRDALKYFILREFKFGYDGNFSVKNFLSRYNYDLANDLGNLVSRSIAMTEKYCCGIIPKKSIVNELDEELKILQDELSKNIDTKMDELDFQGALEEIWKLVRRTNKYIDETTPWVLAKENKERLDTVLYRLLDSILSISISLLPFMPDTAHVIANKLNINITNFKYDDIHSDLLVPGGVVVKGDNIFNRLNLDEEIVRFHEANNKLLIDRLGNNMEQIEKKEEMKKEENQEVPKDKVLLDDEGNPVEDIDFSVFEKVKLRVGEIISCEEHPKADRLLVETIDFGDETRTIVSGIKSHYSPQDLVGKKVVCVVNLKPRKLRGVESHGMVLAAEFEDELSLLTPLNEIEKGAWIH